MRVTHTYSGDEGGPVMKEVKNVTAIPSRNTAKRSS